MKKTILLIMALVFLASCQTRYVEEHITNIKCDANDACPIGLECWALRGGSINGTYCVDENPGEWYCNGKIKAVQESYPPKLVCN